MAAIIRLRRGPMVPVYRMGQTAHAGFPSPADDYIEDVIDLNDVLIGNPIATFLWTHISQVRR